MLTVRPDGLAAMENKRLGDVEGFRQQQLRPSDFIECVNGWRGPSAMLRELSSKKDLRIEVHRSIFSTDADKACEVLMDVGNDSERAGHSHGSLLQSS